MKNIKPIFLIIFLLFLNGCISLQKTKSSESLTLNEDISVIYKKALELINKAQKNIDEGKITEGRIFLDKAVYLFFDVPAEIKEKAEFKIKTEEIIEKASEIEDSIDENNITELFPDSSSLEKISPKETIRIKQTVEKEIKKIKYNIPIIINDNVSQFIKVYTERKKNSLEMGLKRGIEYLPMIFKVLKKYNIPEEIAYLPLLESNFKIKAVSRARAKGLWQFMRSTALLYGLKVNWWLDERYNPEKATDAAARLLKHLYEKYGDWYLALAAYNAGEGRVDRALRRTKVNDFMHLSRTRYLKRETRNYVPAFLALVIIVKDPQRFNIDFPSLNEIEYKKVKIPSPVDLRIVSKKLGISYSTIKKYNPELLRTITPYFLKEYEIKVPKDIPEEKLLTLKKLPIKKRIYWVEHRVKRGETLYRIARKYNVSVRALKSANNLRSNIIRPGRILIITSPGTIKYRKISRKLNYRKLNKKAIFYRVKKGDSLYKISRRYNISVRKIRQWNNLFSNRIFPGDKLIIYF